MNKDRRKKLVEVVEMLRDAQELMNEVKEEEEEAHENLPYSLQGTRNSEKMEENISIELNNKTYTLPARSFNTIVVNE